eukprot:g1732.t1
MQSHFGIGFAEKSNDEIKSYFMSFVTNDSMFLSKEVAMKLVAAVSKEMLNPLDEEECKAAVEEMEMDPHGGEKNRIELPVFQKWFRRSYPTTAEDVASYLHFEFDKFDITHTGALNAPEMANFIHEIGLAQEGKTVEETEKEMDIPISKRGDILFDDFLEWHENRFPEEYRFVRKANRHRSITQSNADIEFKVGSVCEVFFRGRQKWIKGSLDEIDSAGDGHFKSDDGKCQKWVKLMNHNTIRAIETEEMKMEKEELNEKKEEMKMEKEETKMEKEEMKTKAEEIKEKKEEKDGKYDLKHSLPARVKLLVGARRKIKLLRVKRQNEALSEQVQKELEESRRLPPAQYHINMSHLVGVRAELVKLMDEKKNRSGKIASILGSTLATSAGWYNPMDEAISRCKSGGGMDAAEIASMILEEESLTKNDQQQKSLTKNDQQQKKKVGISTHDVEKIEDMIMTDFRVNRVMKGFLRRWGKKYRKKKAKEVEEKMLALSRKRNTNQKKLPPFQGFNKRPLIRSRSPVNRNREKVVRSFLQNNNVFPTTALLSNQVRVNSNDLLQTTLCTDSLVYAVKHRIMFSLLEKFYESYRDVSIKKSMEDDTIFSFDKEDTFERLVAIHQNLINKPKIMLAFQSNATVEIDEKGYVMWDNFQMLLLHLTKLNDDDFDLLKHLFEKDGKVKVKEFILFIQYSKLDLQYINAENFDAVERNRLEKNRITSFKGDYGQSFPGRLKTMRKRMRTVEARRVLEDSVRMPTPKRPEVKQSENEDDNEKPPPIWMTGENAESSDEEGESSHKSDEQNTPNHGWLEIIDPHTKQKYYANKETKRTTWIKPREMILADDLQKGSTNRVIQNLLREHSPKHKDKLLTRKEKEKKARNLLQLGKELFGDSPDTKTEKKLVDLPATPINIKNPRRGYAWKAYQEANQIFKKGKTVGELSKRLDRFQVSLPTSNATKFAKSTVKDHEIDIGKMMTSYKMPALSEDFKMLSHQMQEMVLVSWLLHNLKRKSISTDLFFSYCDLDKSNSFGEEGMFNALFKTRLVERNVYGRKEAHRLFLTFDGWEDLKVGEIDYIEGVVSFRTFKRAIKEVQTLERLWIVRKEVHHHASVYGAEWKRLDAENNGTIRLGEFRKVLMSFKLRLKLTQEDCRNLFHFLDKQNLGFITWNEVVCRLIEEHGPLIGPDPAALLRRKRLGTQDNMHPAHDRFSSGGHIQRTSGRNRYGF